MSAIDAWLKDPAKHMTSYDAIAMLVKLKEYQIEAYAHALDWMLLSMYQVLSEDFMRKYSNQVYWSVVSTDQAMSFEFIMEFVDKLDISLLRYNRHLSLADDQWNAIEIARKMLGLHLT